MARKKRSGFVFLLIILVLLGLLIYAYREKFQVFLDTTFNSSKELYEKKIAKKDNNKKSLLDRIKMLKQKDNKKIKEESKDNYDEVKINIKKIQDDLTKKTEEKKNEIIKKEKENIEKEIVKIIKQEKTEIKKEEQKKEITNGKYNIRQSKIYFSKITEDESLRLIGVTRDVKYTNMPLTETLNTLLNGPTTNEKSNEIITNIPRNTKLLNVYIKGNTAYINLSNDFEYNPYGRESTIAQIMQIVYTTTEFPNINSVQFLINGQKKTYLGGEGIVISKPLTRNDFS